MSEKKLNLDDKEKTKSVNVNQNIESIFIYSLCLMFAFGLNNLLDIFLKDKKTNILFYIIYLTSIIVIIIILSSRIRIKSSFVSL